MRLIGLALAVMAACGSGAPPPAPPPLETMAPKSAPTSVALARERVERTFASAALGVEKRVIVFLPPGYSGNARRYPVIYMLHGLGGFEESWEKIGIAEAADAVGLDAILVLPDGDDSFYVNWDDGALDYDACLAAPRPYGREPDMATYCVRSPRYADYLATDLIGFVDANFRTITKREGRAVGGLSMGGYGALVTAFAHKELFAAVASHAGLASLRYLGPDPFVAKGARLLEDPQVFIMASALVGAHFGRVFGTDIAGWIARDPVALAGQLADGELAIYIDCGTADEFRLGNGAAHLDEVLTGRGIAHEFHLIEGGRHDLDFWQSRIDDSLRFLAAHLAGAQ